MGAHVENADDLAKSISSIPPVRESLTEALGRSFFTPDGELKRSELAAYIFNHPDALQLVNSIVHPPVIAEIARRFELFAEEEGCFVVETALAVSTGYVDDFDIVIAVTADRAERKRRLIEISALSSDQATARMAAQFPQEKIIERADHVLDNNGSIEELEIKARTLYEKLCGNE